ncbi:MAG: AMP-binding protein [Gammaproteobacteria bacterium]|nr:AMP-binding protein [Gammaproteobacteria bacterium]
METPWLAHYQTGVPATINPAQYTSLCDLFFTTCQQHPNHIAFENYGVTLSYQDLKEKSLAFASFLQQSGLKKGDRVAIMLPNLLQYPIALLGALCAGGVIVNTNPLYTPDELSYQLKDAGASFLIVLNQLTHTVEQALPHLKLKKIIVTEVGDCFPFVKRLCTHVYLKYILRQYSSITLANTVTFRDALDIGEKQTFSPTTVSHEDIAFLQYTGGTTGVAKGAMLTHANMLANVLQAYAWITPLGICSQDIVITALPLYHIFALTANCLTFLKAGAKNILITNPRDIKSLINTIKSKKFTAFTGVNTLFNALVNHPLFTKIDFTHVKLSLSGGMALQKSVAEKWHQLTHSRLLEAYGLTETSPAVTINPMYLDHFNGSIGLPLPSTLISLRNDDEQEIAIGEIGELCIKGPQVMLGYWQQPQETQHVFTHDGFLKTGDLAIMDKNGFFYLVDRKKDLIIVSGFNVYPNEIEQVINMHPGVIEVGVTGMLDDTGNERVKAFVVRRDPLLTEAELIAYCRKHLTPYKIPKLIEFREQLPKTNVGKILRRSLASS